MKCAEGPCPYPAKCDGLCGWHRLLRDCTAYELNAVRRRLRRVLPPAKDGEGPTLYKVLAGKFLAPDKGRFRLRRDK